MNGARIVICLVNVRVQLYHFFLQMSKGGQGETHTAAKMLQ